MERTEVDEPFIERKKHRGLKLFLVILLIAALSFGGYYYYTNYYNNPSKKVNEIITDVQEKLLGKYNKSILDKAMKINGLFSFNIDAGKNANEITDLINKLSIQINGEIDTKNMISNLDFNTKYDTGKLIDFKFYLENGDAYLFSKDLYDKYLYLGNTNELTSEIKKSNFEFSDIETIIKSITNAFGKALKTDNVIKSQETITIDNVNKDVNKYSISLKDNELKNFINDMITNLKNDSDFINAMKKMDNDFDINDFKSLEDIPSGSYEIDFFTTKDLLNEELISVRQSFDIDNEKATINIDVLGNDSYKITSIVDGETIETKLTVNEKIFNVEASAKVDDMKITFKINFNFDEISSITKENTTNKISINDMTEEELQKISENLSKNENLIKFVEKIESLGNTLNKAVYGQNT